MGQDSIHLVLCGFTARLCIASQMVSEYMDEPCVGVVVVGGVVFFFQESFH